ncbi:MAG: hypothetical protein LBF97_00495 [Elusimicrobiota bacterium]|jgi:hypothetical protein|nr:hypothetical protein [Elusimicrobiota bacterium]
MLLEGKSTEKAHERMAKLGMTPEQYSIAKTLLRNNGVSIYDFERLKNKAKRAGATTFAEFLNMVKTANKEKIDIDEYLDNKIIEGKSTFTKEVETNLSSTPDPEKESKLSKNIKTKVHVIKKNIKDTPLPIAKRFFIDKTDKALEILGNAINSHSHIINKQDVDLNGADPQYKKTQSDDFKLNSTPVQISVDGVIKTAYELIIGKGQRKPSKIGTSSQPGETTNESDEDRIRAFYLKEGEKTIGRTENEEGRAKVIKEMNVKFFREFLRSKFYEETFGKNDFQSLPSEQLKKAYRKYMLGIIKSRVISPLYSKSNNTYYVSQNVFDTLKKSIKTIENTNTISNQMPENKMVDTKPQKRKSWMAEEIEDWNIKHKKWTTLQKAAKATGGVEAFKQQLLSKLKESKNEQEKKVIAGEINLLIEKEPKKPNFDWLFKMLRQNNMNEADEINTFKESPEYKTYEEKRKKNKINVLSDTNKKLFSEAIIAYKKRIARERGVG